MSTFGLLCSLVSLNPSDIFLRGVAEDACEEQYGHRTISPFLTPLLLEDRGSSLQFSRWRHRTINGLQLIESVVDGIPSFRWGTFHPRDIPDLAYWWSADCPHSQTLGHHNCLDHPRVDPLPRPPGRMRVVGADGQIRLVQQNPILTPAFVEGLRPWYQDG